MKTRVYILTFLTYASINMMRMTYSSNKHHLQQKFAIRSFFLGIIDSTIFLSLSIGTFFRYSILKNNKLKLICLQTAIPTAISFSIIPLISLIKGQQNDKQSNIFTYLIMLFSFGTFGFFQFFFFPALITIFSQYFSIRQQGTLVGIWSSKSNFGNIIGFFITNLLIYQLYQKWQTTMLLSAIILIIITLILYFSVQQIQNGTTQITSTEFYQFVKQKWKQLDFKLYMLSFSCFKAILYSYELWTPIFIADTGYPQFSGYVPMVFDIFTLIGSILMGKLYQSDSKQSEQKHNYLGNMFIKYKFFISSFLVILMALFYVFLPSKIIIYFILGAFMGLFLGGVYNALQNNQILNYTLNNPRNTNMISTINIGIGSTILGILQLIIGILMSMTNQKKHYQHNKQHQDKSTKIIYIIIAIVGILALIISFLRIHLHKNQKGKQQYLQNLKLQNQYYHLHHQQS